MVQIGPEMSPEGPGDTRSRLGRTAQPPVDLCAIFGRDSRHEYLLAVGLVWC